MLRQLAVLALMLLPTSALSERIFFRELIVLPVRQIDANSFEVIEADGAGGVHIWCAAGIFTRKVLHQRGGDIGIVQALGPSPNYPGRKSVVFSTLPVAEPKSSYSTNVRTPGLTFSMAHANAVCGTGFSDTIVRVRVLAN